MTVVLSAVCVARRLTDGERFKREGGRGIVARRGTSTGSIYAILRIYWSYMKLPELLYYFITRPFVLDLHVKYSVFMGLNIYLMRE